jgi:arylsulfatase A-like enzyme
MELMTAAFLAPLATLHAADGKATKPNVVIVYADDMGFGDVSRYGSLFGTRSPASTPNIDRLADEGMLFTQAHSANAVCTPSRYSLLTGIYNFRRFQSISWTYGYADNRENTPPAGDVTLPQWLRTQGYETAAFGKWHLGGKWYAPGTDKRLSYHDEPTDSASVDWTRRIEGHAADIGFDLFLGPAVAINIPPYVYLHNDRVQVWVEDADPARNQYADKLPNGRKGYFRPVTASDTFHLFTSKELNSTVVGTKSAIEGLGDPSYRQIDADPILVADFERYMDERTASGSTKPFFAYVALHSPHLPWAITPKFDDPAHGGYDYARYLAEVDARIGRILAAIDGNGLRKNTLVIFTADNGVEYTGQQRALEYGDDSNGPLRGVKRDVWEGGTRVPFIVRWPGRVAPGTVTDELISQVDIFPTLAASLGEKMEAGIAPDGESFLPVLQGQKRPAPRGGIVVSSFGGHLALKTPDGWKLVDSTGGGGNAKTWDAANNLISNAAGTNRGAPKQLYRISEDIGETTNLIAGLTTDADIRAALIKHTGRDLLATFDELRSTVFIWDGGGADRRIDRAQNWSPNGIPTPAGANSGVVNGSYATTYAHNSGINYDVTYNNTSSLAWDGASGDGRLFLRFNAAFTFNDSSSLSVNERLYMGDITGTGALTLTGNATATVDSGLIFGWGGPSGPEYAGRLTLRGNSSLTTAGAMQWQQATGQESLTHTITLADSAALTVNNTTISSLKGAVLVVNFEQADTRYTPIWTLGEAADFRQTNIQYQINGVNTTLSDPRFVLEGTTLSLKIL